MAHKADRRDFLTRTLRWVPWAISVAFVYPAGQFVLFGEAKRGKLSIPLAQIKEGITPILSDKIYILRQNDHITVFDAHCTHMGCTLIYDKEHEVFNCPCHHSRFSMTGERLRGPAKRDLDTIAYKVSQTNLLIG